MKSGLDPSSIVECRNSLAAPAIEVEAELKAPSTNENWLIQLVQESGPALLRFIARRLASRAEIEDLAQEVYMRLMRVEDTSTIRDPRAFTLRVAANVVYEWRMAARNRFEHTNDAVEGGDDRLDPYRHLLQADEKRRLTQALDRLSPMQRTIVLLHRRDGMTYAEIAKHVGLSVAMVNKHLARALAICKESLAPPDVRE